MLGMPCGPSMSGWKRDDPEPEPAPTDSVNRQAKEKAIEDRTFSNIPVSIEDVYKALGLPLDPEHKPWALKDPVPFGFAKKTFHMPDPEPESAPSDSVNHPSHYTFGDIEVIDYIRDKLTPEEFQGYCNGNVLKYISRWRHKGGVEDLKKADVYLCWMIESALGESQQSDSQKLPG